MLTPREFNQIKIAIFAMGQTKMNGRVLIDGEHVTALLKSYTEGHLMVETSDNGDALDIAFTPAEGSNEKE